MNMREIDECRIIKQTATDIQIMTDKHNADHSALDPKLVRQLDKMLTETHLSEIEVEKGDLGAFGRTQSRHGELRLPHRGLEGHPIPVCGPLKLEPAHLEGFRCGIGGARHRREQAC